MTPVDASGVTRVLDVQAGEGLGDRPRSPSGGRSWIARQEVLAAKGPDPILCSRVGGHVLRVRVDRSLADEGGQRSNAWPGYGEELAATQVEKDHLFPDTACTHVVGEAERRNGR